VSTKSLGAFLSPSIGKANKFSVFGQEWLGTLRLAGYSRPRGSRLKHKPTGIGTRQQVLSKYGLIARLTAGLELRLRNYLLKFG
jgi:hypothetical protein